MASRLGVENCLGSRTSGPARRPSARSVEPRVLDGDDRLVGERLEQSNLTLAEGPPFPPEHLDPERDRPV